MTGAKKISSRQLKNKRGRKQRLTCFKKEEAKTKLIVDASPVALRAVLTKEQSGGTYCQISYTRKSLMHVERRCSQTEQESQAIVWGCEQFHCYLCASQFEMVMDHELLEFLCKKITIFSAKIKRWALHL